MSRNDQEKLPDPQSVQTIGEVDIRPPEWSKPRPLSSVPGDWEVVLLHAPQAELDVDLLRRFEQDEGREVEWVLVEGPRFLSGEGDEMAMAQALPPGEAEAFARWMDGQNVRFTPRKGPRKLVQFRVDTASATAEGRRIRLALLACADGKTSPGVVTSSNYQMGFEDRGQLPIELYVEPPARSVRRAAEAALMSDNLSALVDPGGG